MGGDALGLKDSVWASRYHRTVGLCRSALYSSPWSSEGAGEAEPQVIRKSLQRLQGGSVAAWDRAAPPILSVG